MFLWRVSCIFSVDSWCSQYTCSGNYCQISTTRQAAMLKHKCMKPVLSAQMLMYSFYQRFQSHFTSVNVCCQVLLQYSYGTSEAWESDKQVVECWSNEHLTQATLYSPVAGLVRHSILETFDIGCAIPSFCRQTCKLSLLLPGHCAYLSSEKMEGYFLTMDCLVYTVATSITEVQALYLCDPFLAPICRQNSNVKLV